MGIGGRIVRSRFRMTDFAKVKTTRHHTMDGISMDPFLDLAEQLTGQKFPKGQWVSVRGMWRRGDKMAIDWWEDE